MPKIIPNSKKYLKITRRAFKDKEQYLVYLKKRGGQLVILGLKEWLEERNRRKPVENSRSKKREYGNKRTVSLSKTQFRSGFSIPCF